MKKYAGLLLVALSAALPTSGAQAAANLLTNGSFETGDFTGWTIGGGGFPAVISGPYVGYPGAEDGADYLFTVNELPGEPEPVSQTFSDTPGQTYNVSFWLADAEGVSIDSFSAGVDGGTALSVAPATFGWTRFDFTFIGTGSDTVQFDLDSFLIGWAFDNASVTVAPEPAAWTLMLSGFGVLGTALRSRRVKPAIAGRRRR